VTRVSIAALALAVFAVVATANSGGYRYGASDQAFYLPAVAAELHPTLFPHDRELLGPHMRLWLGDSLIADLARVTGASLPAVFLGIYGLTMILLAAGAVRLGRSLACDWWAIAVFLLLLTLRHRIAKTGANSLEGYMHPRMLAFACGLFVFAEIARGRTLAGFALSGLAVVIHTPTGVWFAAAWAAAVVWRWRTHPRLASAVLAAGLAGALLVLVALRSQLVPMNAEWLEVLREKDYLFSGEWPLYAWVINLAYPVVIVAIYRRRVAGGLVSAGESALVAALLGLVIAFLMSVPLTQARIALAVQIQINRVFWLLDAFTALYVAWWLTADRAARWSSRARATLLALVALVACGRGFYVLRLEARRPLVQVGLPATPWNEAMRWLASQPDSWLVLADPQHAWKYGPSVRVAAWRDTVLEASKDAALAMYDADVAARVADRDRALGTFETLSVDDLRQLAVRYDIDVFVDRATRSFPLRVLYRNGAFVIYDLR